ncbi:MAG: magnesium transporter [Candidatus Woesearchaeota archaeon]|jgi:magnesium transporter
MKREGPPIRQIKLAKTNISYISYSPRSVKKSAGGPKQWINIQGLTNTSALQTIAKKYGIHPLTVEDITHTRQRPKIEVHKKYTFVVCRYMEYNVNKKQLVHEQVSFVLLKNTLISFTESPNNIAIESIIKRLLSKEAALVSQPPIALLHALLDAVVDRYFVVMEDINELLEDVEETIADDPKREDMVALQRIKRQNLFFRKSVVPLRDVTHSIMRIDNKGISDHAKLYFSDVYDHVVQIIDAAETNRDLLSSLIDLYLSSNSNKLNQIMKVLTVISTIFIPLTFITGLYGMNFDYMPELSWQYGYFSIIIVMLMISLFMVRFFRRKNWL